MKVETEYNDYPADNSGEKWCKSILVFQTFMQYNQKINMMFHRISWEQEKPRSGATGQWRVKYKTA